MTWVRWAVLGCIAALLALPGTMLGETVDRDVRRNCTLLYGTGGTGGIGRTGGTAECLDGLRADDHAGVRTPVRSVLPVPFSSWQLPPACPRADLPAYAHNDYRNDNPLRDAMALGYRGVEADVYLVNGVLRLGHDRREARRGVSFEQRYLVPLDSLLTECNDSSPHRPLLLFVELKEASRESYDSLVVQLARFPRIARAVTLVLVGWHPASPVLDSAPVPIGRQLRLDRAAAPTSAEIDRHVRLLSVDYGKTFGRWWVRASSRQRWLEALRKTKADHPSLLLRVHNVPVDARIYQPLCGAGVDLIGTKSLANTAVALQDAIGCGQR